MAFAGLSIISDLVAQTRLLAVREGSVLVAKRNEEVFRTEIAAEKIFDSEIVGSANRIDVIF